MEAILIITILWHVEAPTVSVNSIAFNTMDACKTAAASFKMPPMKQSHKSYLTSFEVYTVCVPKGVPNNR